MFARLLLLLILVPLADLILLLLIAQCTGWTSSLLLVLVSGLLGVWLARRQSIFVGRKLLAQLPENELPPRLITDSAMILFAAGLLIAPGLITDLIGLSLLIPAIRAQYKRQILRGLKKQFDVQITQMKTVPMDDSVIDGEVVSSSDVQFGQQRLLEGKPKEVRKTPTRTGRKAS